MDTRPLTLESFRALVPTLCDLGTSADHQGWSPRNPTWGHCAVVALLAQNHFGGKLLRVSLEGTPFAAAGSHYYNQFPDGSAHDFTESQFASWRPDRFAAQERSRDYVLNAGTGTTKTRYIVLAWRLIQALYKNIWPSLFAGPRFEQCIKLALASPCQKMGFGAVLLRDSTEIASANNHPLPGMESLCTPTCVRFQIQSRTESMIGSCEHAEGWTIWQAMKERRHLLGHNTALFVAGVGQNGLPLMKIDPEFTCLRCAVAIAHAEIKMVYVPVMGSWRGLTAQQCLDTAKAYALGQKKV